MRKVTKIIVHCTESMSNVGTRPYNILMRQAQSRIGYHFIVFEDGTVFKANDVSNVINHCRGHNADSIAVAYVGGIDDKGIMADTRTDAQKTTLRTLLVALLRKYPVPIYGHRHFDNGKVCPCFDADTEYKGLLQCVPVMPDLAKPSVSFT